MSFTVTDDAVREFADRICSGRSTSDVFPGKMSDCAFTPEQREIIKKARLQKKAQGKGTKATLAKEIDATTVTPKNYSSVPIKANPLTKLEKMLYLQSGRCFFCGEPLDISEASIEHLWPVSQGGQRIESNEVVCHKTVNDAFGAMDLKRKFEFIIRSAGEFTCPRFQKKN